jgi:hypothetical protein
LRRASGKESNIADDEHRRVECIDRLVADRELPLPIEIPKRVGQLIGTKPESQPHANLRCSRADCALILMAARARKRDIITQPWL